MHLIFLQRDIVYSYIIFLLLYLHNIYREEVLREQFGIRLQSNTAQRGASSSSTSQRQQQQTLSSIVGASTAALLALDENSEPPQEVSPEFLAALPEDVQREVRSFFFKKTVESLLRSDTIGAKVSFRYIKRFYCVMNRLLSLTVLQKVIEFELDILFK